ncbi:LacI family DNA-binding transcriptional regulator [Cellulomonas sp. NS3]|uniref:LacI family DNA-binding transcriptional regulator n=1 Tax=Cellulomonas sp. NS3 TaxID=2973977 RepID=UPI00216180E5|nr:LacI family DNA-binding transcriptional regulator [Cellulomonas sp. NS3]
MADPATSAARPTLEDVARVAGVSRATVSRVVNGRQDVAEHLQELVREAIARTGYVPNRAARSLVTRRSGLVVVAVGGAASPHGPPDEVDFHDPFVGRAVGGILRALRPRDVDPVLMLAETDADRARVLAHLQQGHADGALLVSTRPDDPLAPLLVDAGVPSVIFAHPAAPLPVSFVDVGNREGGALAAEHLVARGRHRLAVIEGPPDVPSAQERLAGFRDVAARHGLPVVTAPGGFSFVSGAEAMRSLLARGPELDGVFAANDLMALGAVDVLEDAGRRVPHDVSVVGFDDSALAPVARPALTSVRQPIEEMTAEMVAILLAQIDAPERRVTGSIFEATLQVRASS